ncbi:uncharacterized protein inaF-D isoform X2 [Maniola hyperantus]|uniref:uncharacterized protein inaF-D isoform X2 n=1 Tax=Aphantopus hyperantus TaxID=2795564 RepID=UPI001568ACC5|nr:uncharacterized protein LOC117990424 isoform X2 [Maniola hyperantus]
MSGPAGEGDGGTAEAGASPVQDLYREKPPSTVVRVMTVLAYLLSVSFAAILLSIYYICVWKSPVIAKLTDNRDMLGARRGDPSDYSPTYTHDIPHHFTGGSDTPVNETATPPTLDSFANFTKYETTENTETIVDYVETSTIPSEQDYTSNDNETLNVTTIT